MLQLKTDIDINGSTPCLLDCQLHISRIRHQVITRLERNDVDLCRYLRIRQDIEVPAGGRRRCTGRNSVDEYIDRILARRECALIRWLDVQRHKVNELIREVILVRTGEGDGTLSLSDWRCSIMHHLEPNIKLHRRPTGLRDLQR